MEIVSLAHLLVTKSVAISGLLMTLTRMNVNWNVKVNLKLLNIYTYINSYNRTTSIVCLFLQLYSFRICDHRTSSERLF